MNGKWILLKVLVPTLNPATTCNAHFSLKKDTRKIFLEMSLVPDPKLRPRLGFVCSDRLLCILRGNPIIYFVHSTDYYWLHKRN